MLIKEKFRIYRKTRKGKYYTNFSGIIKITNHKIWFSFLLNLSLAQIVQLKNSTDLHNLYLHF